MSPESEVPGTGALQYERVFAAAAPSASEIFVGQVETAVIGALPGGEGRASFVRFLDGAHTQLHTHENEQVLIIVEGEGHVGRPGADRVVRAGEVVRIPAGVPHYHGAPVDGAMAHVGVLAGGTTILHETIPWPPA